MFRCVPRWLAFLVIATLGCRSDSTRTECDPPIAKHVARKNLNSNGTPSVFPPGPPSHPPTTLVLAYDDFGPQGSAGKLLGAEWYQWEQGGSYESDDFFDVRVVVYRDVPLTSVEAEYPTIKGASDYRYVESREALKHLDSEIAERETDREPSLESLLAQLRATRARIAR
jgi:hypothetical protein